MKLNGFAANGGVDGAVSELFAVPIQQTADKVDKISTEMISNLDKRTIAKLKSMLLRVSWRPICRGNVLPRWLYPWAKCS